VVRFLVAYPRSALIAVVVCTYANTLRNRPVLDDGWVIFDNSLIKSLHNVPAIFRQPYNVRTPTWNNAGLYRPVTTLSYAINYAIGGRYVVGYHLVSIALHVLCCLLVFELGRRLASAARAENPVGVALLGALLFAVHPVHVEAVTAMVGRAELLAALGSLGCLYLTCTRAQAPWRYPAALVVLVLGVLSKENAAVTPLLFCLVALTVPEAVGLAARPNPLTAEGRRAAWRVGALAAGMAAAVVPYLLLHPGRAGIPIGSQWFQGQPRAVVFYTMTRVVAEYLRLLVFPHPLGVDFYYAQKIQFTPSLTPATLAGAALGLAVLGFGVVALRRAPLVGLGILWVFIALLPVLNIIPIGALMGERLLYLPSVGFCLAAGAGAALLLEAARSARPVVAAGLAVVGLVLAAKSLVRNAEWRNALTLYEVEVRKTPTDATLNNNLAVEYTARGQFDLARQRLEVVLRVAPWYWRAQVNMGIVAHQQHDDSAAMRWLEQANRIAPTESDPYFFMGIVAADGGKLTDAVDYLTRAEEADPADARTHLYRGRYLARLGRAAEAEQELRRARELDPGLPSGP
jgi:protein O-mannosyl-transferase